MIPKIKTLISYQDVSVHKGIIYKASGWEPVAYKKFQLWSKRKTTSKGQRYERNEPQSTGDKIRWQKEIR